jgi:hypothetical protein
MARAKKPGVGHNSMPSMRESSVRIPPVTEPRLPPGFALAVMMFAALIFWAIVAAELIVWFF